MKTSRFSDTKIMGILKQAENGPEFIATELREWLARLNVKTFYIEPGSPWDF